MNTAQEISKNEDAGNDNDNHSIDELINEVLELANSSSDETIRNVLPDKLKKIQSRISNLPVKSAIPPPPLPSAVPPPPPPPPPPPLPPTPSFPTNTLKITKKGRPPVSITQNGKEPLLPKMTTQKTPKMINDHFAPLILEFTVLDQCSLHNEFRLDSQSGSRTNKGQSVGCFDRTLNGKSA